MERTLTAEASQRLASLREEATAQRRTIVASLSTEGPTDTLEAIAWVTGIEGPMPDDPGRLIELFERARAERLTWREISDAAGEGSSETAARRVRERYRLWTAPRA